MVLSGFVRVVTHPRIFDLPATLHEALEFCEFVRNGRHPVVVAPGALHWQIFSDLCVQTRATGNLVADAYLAALAIESDCEWITTDRDYRKFPGLRWRHPF